MNFHEVTVWVEAHPGESVLIGGGALIAILWLLGYFSPTAQAPAQDPLAAAYYAAEAQQAVVAGQIQQTTLTTAAQTAQTGIQANAAVAINAAQAGAATTINGQNTGAATTINQAQVSGAQAIQLGVSSDQLQATYSNNATALATAQSNNATAQAINASNNDTSVFSQYIGSIFAPETMGGTQQPSGGIFLPSGALGRIVGAPVSGTPGWYQMAGYTPAQLANVFGAGVTYPKTVN
jgi:hypothetical protein